MKPNIDKIRNEFFKKSLSVGYHNVKYTWMQIMAMIISCIRSLESFEEGAKEPSAQTLRDHLRLDGDWLDYFHDSVWQIATYAVRVLSRYNWWISLDETYIPFFGKRKKLNSELCKKRLGKLVYGYKAKTPGATGSFCFLIISLCCCRIRIPIAIKMIAIGENYASWLEPRLKRLLKLVPKARVLADRGFGKAVWFYRLMEKLDANYVVRVPLRKKENKRKVENGSSRFQYWMKEAKTNDKVLITIYVVKDKQGNLYLLASNLSDKTGKQLLTMYMNRWDLENIFKDTDRVELPTSSRNPVMRLFCVVVSFFMFTLWQIKPFLDKVIRGSLRGFVKQILNVLCGLLQCIITPLGKIVRAPP